MAQYWFSSSSFQNYRPCLHLPPDLVYLLMKNHACNPITNLFIYYISGHISLGSVSFVILRILFHAFTSCNAPGKDPRGGARFLE